MTSRLQHPSRNPASFLDSTVAQWGGRSDLWIFGYASLIWRPDFDFIEQRPARVHGWHRALKMWSRINRGTPDCPGLVFALLSGGCCHGTAFRVSHEKGHDVLETLWQREMVSGVYDPRWLSCATPEGPVNALAFTLSRRSPSFTGKLSEAQYREIFSVARGRYGSTHAYALQTFECLKSRGIHDRELEKLLGLS